MQIDSAPAATPIISAASYFGEVTVSINYSTICQFVGFLLQHFIPARTMVSGVACLGEYFQAWFVVGSYL
jgi:hypothetical protein